MAPTLLDILCSIPDPRRGQGKMYPQGHVLFFCILAVTAGAVSYRRMHSFIRARFSLLSNVFPSKMRRPPTYCTIRNIIGGVGQEDIEAAFRLHASSLVPTGCAGTVALDGKVLRGSFDAMEDRRAAQVLGAFAGDGDIVLAHVMMGDKESEIPAAQRLIAELGLTGILFTADAAHCQKKPSTP